MKKILSFIAIAASLMLIGTKASAQFSLGAGYANSVQKLSVSGIDKTASMNGVYVGLDYNVAISENFGIAPGIYYEFSSGLANDLISLPNLGGLLKGRLDEHFIDVPVNFNFSIPFNGNRAFIYAGPTFSYGVASSVKADASILGINIKGDVLDLFEKDLFTNFDILVGGGIGFDFNDMVRFTVGYNMGMLNRLDLDSTTSAEGEGNIISNIKSFITDNATINKNVFHVGVAVLF